MGSDSPEEKFQKRMKWLKWLGGSIIGIFIAGYFVGVELHALAKTEDVDRAIESFSEEHNADHTSLTRQIRLVQSEQRTQSARQRSLDLKMDLVLMGLEERPRTRTEAESRQHRERALTRDIAAQQNVVEELERALEEEYTVEDDEVGD